jgi:HK97 family phage prohead protease
MPWHIEQAYESCQGFAVVKDSDGSIAGCHETEAAASKQLAALYASEPEARAAKYDHIDFNPPSGVREEANRGLAWRREFGRGGTAVGIARARDLGNGTKISPDTARRMKAFFDRHQSDKTAEGWAPGEKGFPSNGRIAHALWGGDAGYSWSKKLVRQMNAADERSSVMQVETRSLCFDDDESFPLLRIERRCCEERSDAPEESWLVGYAARFGVNSLKMDDFYERIDPDAFSIVAERRGRKSPLETRALFNHDPNHVLGRFPTTLRMQVDDLGLRYEVKMPESRRDLMESIERGDIRGSSFSFVIAPGGEEWSVEEGRSIRTVKSIASLIDVGPVTFPAYPDASVAVARRSYDSFVLGQRARRKELDAIRSNKAEIQKFLRERGR